MSVLDLEKTAMMPRRYIDFCRRLEERVLNDPGAILSPGATEDRKISVNSTDVRTCQFYMVPGGRYLVIFSPRTLEGNGSISVLDLRCSSSTDCKLIDSVELEAEYQEWTTFTVQATPDGMGLSIFLTTV